MILSPFSGAIGDERAPLEIQRLVAQLEGGWYDGSEERDPNPTMHGITQSVYDAHRRAYGQPLQSVRFVSELEEAAIYRGYWRDASCASFPRLVAYSLYDHTINAGKYRAIQALQRAVRVEADGIIGPITRAAVERYLQLGEQGERALASLLQTQRLRYYWRLAVDSQRLRPNLTSWVQRIVLFNERFL